MKVEFCETVEVTGTANISIDDIQVALLEALRDVDIQMERGIATEREKRWVLNQFANSIHQCLEGVTDAAIFAASDEMREMFAASLRKQAERWSTNARS